MPATAAVDNTSRAERAVPSPANRASAPAANRASAVPAPAGPRKKPTMDDHPILFQKFFKSVGPRTYVSQIRRATNGNHYLVLTEGQRKDDSDEVRKTRIFLYSEDFVEFFRMIRETAEWIKANPVPAEVRQKRQRFWAKENNSKVRRASTLPAAAPG